jgi:predicted dinucleotide-binding enzyme
MRIGIVGAGRIGGTLAQLFVGAGHEVAVSNSRGPETLADLVDALGGSAVAMTAEQAAEFGELVVVSIPLRRYRDVPVEPLAGKIVIDTNNYYPDRDGRIEALDRGDTTCSELLQAHLGRARVVKAFNAIYWERLANLGRPSDSSERLAIPISGDDAEAKAAVAELIDEIGFDAIDAGDLAHGGVLHQPGSAAYNVALTATELLQVLEEQ